MIDCRREHEGVEAPHGSTLGGRDPSEECHDRFLLAVASNDATRLPKRVPDVEQLVYLIARHRLAGRCHRMRAAFRKLGYPASLLEAVESSWDEVQATYRRNADAIAALSASLGEFGVLIKGISTFLLTRDEASLRVGDIDLVVDEPDRVVRTLLNSGFVRTRDPFLHEVGEFVKDHREVDVQSGFPVQRYPDPLLDTHGGLSRPVSVVDHVTPVSMLDYAQLRAGAQHRRLTGQTVLVPSPEALVLVIAAHSFMNHCNIWSISHRKKTWIRLSELSDVLELTAHTQFSVPRFAALVAEHRAQDVVRWTNQVCKLLFDRQPFPALAHRGDAKAIQSGLTTPCCVWWNHWVEITSNVRTLLRADWYPFSQVVRALERDGCPVLRPGDRTLSPLPAAATTGDSSGGAHLRFACGWDGRQLLLGTVGGTNEHRPTLRVRVDCGTDAREIAMTQEDAKRATGTDDEGPVVRVDMSDFQQHSSPLVALLADYEGRFAASAMFTLETDTTHFTGGSA